MKRFFIAIFVLTLLVSPIVIYAQTSPDCSNTSSTTLCNPVRYSQDDLTLFAFKLVSIFSGFFAITALVMVVFSGFRMILSQGDSEALTAAKSAFTWSILGLILAMFAFVIIYATGEYIGTKNLNPDSYVGNNQVINPLKDATFLDLLIRMLTGFLSVAGIIAILMIVLGGFRYITSGGNEELTESGKKTLQWAIIGLVAILLSYVLVQATLTFFGG